MKRSQRRCWKSYCSESLDKIEHYEEALADNFVGWCMHHRLEIQQDKRVSMQELKDKDLYYDRPANELVFMRWPEHNRLHLIGNTYTKGKQLSEETRLKMSAAHKGENNPLFGKHHSAETRQKMSAAKRGKNLSEEHRLKMSKSWKGMLWWNNGISSIRSRECPGEGWTRGRLRCK